MPMTGLWENGINIISKRKTLGARLNNDREVATINFANNFAMNLK